MTTTTLELADRARQSALAMQCVTTADKDAALVALGELLVQHRERVMTANALDLESARESVESGKLSASTYKRLDVGGGKFAALVEGVAAVVAMRDPCDAVQLATRLDHGLELYRVSCPVGVLLVIFEARPEVLIQISCLAVKSGNAVILKGGKEAAHTLRALHALVEEALARGNLPTNTVQLIFTRDQVQPLLKMDRHIDLVIPRGSKELVRHVQESTRIPVLGHADGLCSIYVHEDADLSMAVDVIVDAKTDYPAACNAVETVLLHENIADRLLPLLLPALSAKNVEVRLEQSLYDRYARAAGAIAENANIKLATDADFDTEFIDLILAIRSVPSLNAAITHINTHGSRHTDAILAADPVSARHFQRTVDAAGVYWNASTRFADGHRYGFGAEIGVSTSKTHARGPVGLEGLMIYKYKMVGGGHCAEWFGSGDEGKRRFLHEEIAEGERWAL